MSISFEFEKQDRIGLFRVSNKLGRGELIQAQKECEGIINEIGRIKLLVILDDFRGWQKSKGWEDLSFSERNDSHITRIAIVGDEKWKDLVYAFTVKGLRPVLIEFFDEAAQTKARNWLNESD